MNSIAAAAWFAAFAPAGTPREVLQTLNRKINAANLKVQ